MALRVLFAGRYRPATDLEALKPTNRQYTRDSDGRFASRGGDGDGGTVVASKRMSGRDSENEMDLSVIRGEDGATRLHVGVGFEGATEGVSAALDHAGVRRLQDGITAGVAAGEVRQREVRGLQAKADELDAQITVLDQKTMGPATEHGREFVPLSPADEATRAGLRREWEAVDDRIGELEGGDGEQVASGVVHGAGGDVHYAVTVKLPAKWSSVSVAVAEPGRDPDSDASMYVTFKGAGRLADDLGAMADLM